MSTDPLGAASSFDDLSVDSYGADMRYAVRINRVAVGEFATEAEALRHVRQAIADNPHSEPDSQRRDRPASRASSDGGSAGRLGEQNRLLIASKPACRRMIVAGCQSTREGDGSTSG
jgi:hypothetical protein